MRHVRHIAIVMVVVLVMGSSSAFAATMVEYGIRFSAVNLPEDTSSEIRVKNLDAPGGFTWSLRLEYLDDTDSVPPVKPVLLEPGKTHFIGTDVTGKTLYPIVRATATNCPNCPNPGCRNCPSLGLQVDCTIVDAQLGTLLVVPPANLIVPGPH